MSFEKMQIRDFVEKVADKSPTPGGGAVSAIVACFGAALNEMVAQLTLSRQDYAEWHAEMERVVEEMEELRHMLIELSESDARAFDEVMEAYKLPKETEEEKERRKKSIQDALKRAAHIPYEICRYSRDVIKAAQIVARWGNVNAISDAISAAELAAGAFRSAKANVLINLKSIKDETFVRDMMHELKTLTGEIEGALRDVREIAKQRAGIEV
ncbi:cyclodeaminase/cyclohydrolase family protein [Pseudothermotoga sp.]|nr:cyclodeaminase/cyclohydrolase family protein [Pseudothermotoga sp.]MCX7812342.1 cyclodeaminase/cyclohydrolase family protein [Pseudothermotoga sp.]MDW8139412.1 cyclodeaminase/cyclohydrolase family protein [Pseudothermotoga sp.]